MPSLGEIELWQTVWGAFLGNMAISDWYLKNRFFLNLDKIQKRVLGGKLIVNKANTNTQLIQQLTQCLWLIYDIFLIIYMVHMYCLSGSNGALQYHCHGQKIGSN